MARVAPKGRPCTGINCRCCEQWQEITSRTLSVAEHLAHIASISVGENALNGEIIQMLQAAEATLADESAGKDDTICSLQAVEAALADESAGKDDTICSLQAVEAALADESAGKDDTICSLQAVEAALADESAGKDDTICILQATETALVEDNKRLTKANNDLNAKNNGIKTVPDKDRVSTGRVGRPRGQKATINRRPKQIDREEVVDIERCPKGHPLSETITGGYDRVVTVKRITTENVKYIINRRWCKKCKKQFNARPPNVAPYARVSINQSAIATSLNMNGLSHGKVAKFCVDALGGNESRSWSYRNKISASRRLAPEHEYIQEQILLEPYLQCDEIWWTMPKSSTSKVLMVRGAKFCLAKVVWSATIEAVKLLLPGYLGIVGQDSNTIWLHVGLIHQFCMQHQRRLSKKDLKHLNPKGDALEFLTALHRLDYKHHVYNKIEDPHTRMVAARCLEKERSELLRATYADTTEVIITRRMKRHTREGMFMTTHMYREEVDPDNNEVERANRLFKSIRDDGGGNRTQKGMDANSILFTIMATDWINGASFFDHLIRSANGISTPESGSASGDG